MHPHSLSYEFLNKNPMPFNSSGMGRNRIVFLIIGKNYTWPPRKPGGSFLDLAQATLGDELALYWKISISFCLFRLDSRTILRHSPEHSPDMSLDGIVFIMDTS